MKWCLIDDDGSCATHSMIVAGGTIYRVMQRGHVALCFVPAPPSYGVPAYSPPLVPFSPLSKPYNPNDHTITCGAPEGVL